MNKKELTKTLIWVIASFLVMFVLPWVTVSARYSLGVFSLFIWLIIVPAFSVAVGVYTGRDIKKRWFLPLLSPVFFLISTFVSDPYDHLQYIIIVISCLTIGSTSIMISYFKFKKDKKTTKIYIFLVVLCLLFTPIRAFALDGGTATYFSVLGLYRITDYNQIIYPESLPVYRVFEDVTYDYGIESGNRTGIEIRIFNHVVYNNTHDEFETPPYEDEVKDLISYLNTNGIDGIGLNKIRIDARTDGHIDLYFNGSPDYGSMNDLSGLIKDYLDNNPDLGLFDGRGVYFTIEENTGTDYVTYSMDPADGTVSRIIITPGMITGESIDFPEFIDIEDIWFSDEPQLTDEQIESLGQMFPGCKVYIKKYFHSIVRFSEDPTFVLPD